MVSDTIELLRCFCFRFFNMFVITNLGLFRIIDVQWKTIIMAVLICLIS